jgi:hypothetical protein
MNLPFSLSRIKFFLVTNCKNSQIEFRALFGITLFASHSSGTDKKFWGINDLHTRLGEARKFNEPLQTESTAESFHSRNFVQPNSGFKNVFDRCSNSYGHYGWESDPQ